MKSVKTGKSWSLSLSLFMNYAYILYYKKKLLQKQYFLPKAYLPIKLVAIFQHLNFCLNIHLIIFVGVSARSSSHSNATAASAA